MKKFKRTQYLNDKYYNTIHVNLFNELIRDSLICSKYILIITINAYTVNGTNKWSIYYEKI